ncbi:MAG: shikimate dehydrogenase [Altererythrobacter sp. XM-24bin4]|jgi:shikimate dehydrogenase|uniref:shikimate dehydrogenase n=1 Tax=uncultured Altererythrobacter sp. TaxID=500840 RepID=UPI000D7A65FD|nr:shikimate dehydrogenase [uncultured Altererythrobacter sp.]PWL25224.1 MAG: shikimate dehydrogenase [Altererythrobacter sp. XM-24bin4]
MIKPYAEVIGDPIAHSKSPAIHNFWLEKLGAAPTYRAQHVLSDKLGDYIKSRRSDPEWRGCNITMPHKQAAIDLADRLDPVATQIGAINTLVREGDQLIGYNTDAVGFLEPLRGELSQEHYFRMARVLGTGGAARAIVAGLAGQGFTIVLAGRNPDKARSILEEVAPKGQHHAVHLDHFAEPTDFAFDDRDGCLDLVVNASALGMRGQSELAFDWSHAPPGAIAYDIVTDPLDTALLRNARAAGHQTLDGLNMLIGQAAAAFEKFFGQAAPREHDAQLRELLTR